MDHIFEEMVAIKNSNQPWLTHPKEFFRDAWRDDSKLDLMSDEDVKTMEDVFSKHQLFSERSSLLQRRKAGQDSQTPGAEAYRVVQDALKHPDKLVALSKGSWSKLLATARIIPRGFQGKSCDFARELSHAKTMATITAPLRHAPPSSFRHVGVIGRLDLEFVRKVDAVIGPDWTTVPRLELCQGRKGMFDQNGDPRTAEHPCDAPYGSFYSIPDDVDPDDSTSIICDLKAATLLKMFDLTVFDVNVSPDMEAYFRSLGPFPWEDE